MKTAVLHALGQSPRHEGFADPHATRGAVLGRGQAASLKNVERMMASGSHYDRLPDLPCVCGVDGVGLLDGGADDGARVFCGGARPPYGMMAERAVVSRAWCLPVPEQVDDVTAAALPNPALSAWLSLIWRARLQPGETVLILGATGVAGQLAVQIARHLGAERAVAAGRNRRVLTTLRDLGADATIALDLPDQELTAAFIRQAGPRPFDVVLDYVWGHPTEVLLETLTRHDVKMAASRTRLVEIGEMAGPTIALSAAALRSSGLELYGSGGRRVAPPAPLLSLPSSIASAT